MSDKKLRVIIVDDEAAARFTIARQLEKLDFCEIVGGAETGAKALELIAAKAPDVVLVDVSMPGMNGIELAERIGESTSRSPKFATVMSSRTRTISRR